MDRPQQSGVTRPRATVLPRLPQHIVELEAARRRLDRWGAVTVVRGVQGYGKTTTVAAWLHDQGREVLPVWVNASSSRQDSASSFTSALAAAIGRARADDLDPGEAGRRGRGADADPIATLGQLADGIPAGQRLVLVIDDAHHLRDVKLLESLLDAVMWRHHLHLVLCSRGRHPVETLASGRIDLVSVPARSLLLSPAQVSDLAERMGVPITRDQVEELHRAFGGWAAPVRLVLTEISDPVTRLPLSRAKRFLVKQVLPGIVDRELLHEIGRFVLAERLTHQLIRDLCEPDQDADRLVKLIESPGLAERIYHADDVELVFPEFLRSGLRERFTAEAPDLARVLHQRFSRWYMEHPGPSHSLHALSHAVQAEDWVQMDRVWQRHSTRLAFDHLESLGDVVARIDKTVLRARPSLTVAADMSRAGRFADARTDGGNVVLRAYADAARRVSASSLKDASLHELVFVASGQVMGTRLTSDLAAADHLASRVLGVAEQRSASGEHPGDHVACLHLQQGITRTLQGRHGIAIDSYQRCWELRRDCHPDVPANAASKLAMTHAIKGDPQSAREWATRYRALSRDGAWGRLFGIGASVAEALMALDNLDNDTCLKRSSALPAATLDVELWPFLAFVRAQVGLHLSDSGAALAHLDAAQRAHEVALPRMPAAQVLLTRARADLLLASGQGNYTRALLLSADAEAIPQLAVPLARLALLADQPFEACRIVANVLWRDDVDNRSKLELLLIKAVASHHMGDQEVADDMATRATSLAQEIELFRPFTTLTSDELELVQGMTRMKLPEDVLRAIDNEARPFPTRVELITLTPRELQLVEALSSASSRQEIADRLFVSVNTIRSQLLTLYRKLKVGTREEALVRLAQLGLTTSGDAGGHPR